MVIIKDDFVVMSGENLMVQDDIIKIMSFDGLVLIEQIFNDVNCVSSGIYLVVVIENWNKEYISIEIKDMSDEGEYY